MSNVVVKVVNTQHPKEEINLADLTQTGLGVLIYQCELLLDELKDAEAIIDD